MSGVTDSVMDFVKVPKERVAVIIGKKGATRKKIEELTSTRIHVNSKTGEVNIERPLSEKPELQLRAREIIKAIGVGFPPQKAFKLLSDNIYLSVIDLTESVGESEKQLSRIKARIIGKEGKARATIARMTSTEIQIFSDAVSILGHSEDVYLAEEAVTRLIQGSSHNAVFRFLERKTLR